ncbi:ABC transporter ATP-binding protein [Bordetella ansorpii]|uniref:ABC transporter ATP-binding protein n=1 Tax=Bordetella ansorpii TaxID=288768 RepID=A0A157NIQ8_9BORD|nr:ABC transporter ATP-binding protein [Bordetella ansorpii]SAI21242.1 ABC transporter ATP-binding protein [Bordetella ansorpii]
MTDAFEGLRVRRLQAGYRGKPILQGLDLPDLLPGQVTALIGPNGAGKSTLLKAMAGLIPTQGELALHGQALDRMSPAQRAAHVGYMPQRLPDDLDITVLESLLSILRVCGQGTETAMPRALATLERLGIAALAMQPLGSLSGGQRQMASLAQALATSPQVLLLDEPTSALDLRHQVAVMRTVRALAREQCIVVAVLHDLNLAARWADSAVVLKAGALCASGPPRQALTPDVLARTYGVRARVETCTQGFLTVLADAPLEEDATA